MIRKFITLFIFAVFVWLIWSFSGRNTPLPKSDSYVSVTEEINPSDTLLRNIVGVQPYMEVSDYFDQGVFKEKMRQYLLAASSKAFIKEKTLVVYPEHLGTWLLLLGEKRAIAEVKSLREAMGILIFSNAFDCFLGYLKTGNEANKEMSSLFRMKAKSMAKAYFETFSELALETKTYIVAGSIILPDPRVVDGGIYLKTEGPLYNASFLFGPDGKIVGKPILKAFPYAAESPFTDSADPKTAQVFDLPFGKTSVMLSNDSWYSQSYENAVSDSAEVILVPSFYAGNYSMGSKWEGYDGYESSESLDTADIGKVTNREAWEKYGLAAQIKNTKASVGLTVFFRGDLWNLGSDGQPIAIINNKTHPITPAGKGGIWSLNF